MKFSVTERSVNVWDRDEFRGCSEEEGYYS